VTCADCDAAKYAQPHGYPYRWGRANIEINGCQAHVKEVMDVLSAYQLAEREKKENPPVVF
jgi:hypothetical protein